MQKELDRVGYEWNRAETYFEVLGRGNRGLDQNGERWTDMKDVLEMEMMTRLLIGYKGKGRSQRWLSGIRLEYLEYMVIVVIQ